MSAGTGPGGGVVSGHLTTVRGSMNAETATVGMRMPDRSAKAALSGRRGRVRRLGPAAASSCLVGASGSITARYGR